MLQNKIIYKTGTASETQIAQHLTLCNNQFVPPLNQKVNIIVYAKKIAENSVTFEAWNNTELAGLVAAYFNDEKKVTVYITNVSTLKIFRGVGIATTLIKMCIENAAAQKFEAIILEVDKDNETALALYKKNKFIQMGIKNHSVIMRRIIP
ncbi:MAG: GNAT family N-acetyltransferase [Ferruginibacter sp.]